MKKFSRYMTMRRRDQDFNGFMYRADGYDRNNELCEAFEVNNKAALQKLLRAEKARYPYISWVVSKVQYRHGVAAKRTTVDMRHFASTPNMRRVGGKRVKRYGSRR